MRHFIPILLFCLPALAVDLIWDDSPDHDASTRYNLYQSADANQWRLVALTKTNFVTAHLLPGSNYFIVTISRLNGTEESAPSNTLGLRGYHFERVQAQAIVIGP